MHELFCKPPVTGTSTDGTAEYVARSVGAGVPALDLKQGATFRFRVLE